MSIQSEINRISGNVANALTAIANKGVTVPQGANSDDLATLIGQIQTGGGTGAISIVDTPDAAGGTVRTITATDISDTTAVAGDVAQGKYFYTAAGVKTAGTASGGGGGSVSPKQVNFIDYDGAVLYAYTAQEANALTALPANPSHSGLTAQGWNWSLAQIKAQLTAMPDGDVWVGQMYITQSGDTEIDVSMLEGRLSPILTIAVNGEVTVDWGDNTSADTVTGSSLTTRKAVPHTYAAIGDYTIKIHVTSGSFTFYGSSAYTLLRKNTTSNENYVYANCIHAVRLGSGITRINNSAFYNCISLVYVTIPSAVETLENFVFGYCFSLISVTLPNGITSIPQSLLYNCYGMASISVPSAVSSVGQYAFYGCYSLRSITIPYSASFSAQVSIFQNCYSLAEITIPSSVTNLGTNIFNSCYSLTSFTVPSNVTSIGNSAFNNCYGVAEYHIKPTTPPTLGTTVFNSIVSDCVIFVPSAKLNDYKTAENWSAYASYMQGE